ncbi:MAG TPA: ThuA domain-containing protein [Planctomycetota bacterium]|nr:ThuA domain-containing protein [Planctomycetota bacterium]
MQNSKFKIQNGTEKSNSWLRRPFLSLIIFVWVVAGAQSNLWAGDDAAATKRILFFTKSQRSEHSVIKREGDTPSFAEKVLGEMAAKNKWEIVTSKDGTIFTPENLAKFDALLFYSNGTLTEPGIDGSPPMTEAGKAALIEAVRNGLPLIAVHTALTTFNRKPGKIDPYLEMLGAEGISHNAQQKARNSCVDPKFPGFEDLKDGLELFEEWYSIKNFAKDLHVILVQESKGMTGNLYVRQPYPATWARMFGKGRVFVTSLGHREDVWTNPVFQKILTGGVSWALGRADADITPNIETVTPFYSDLPPEK